MRTDCRHAVLPPTDTGTSSGCRKAVGRSGDPSRRCPCATTPPASGAPRPVGHTCRKVRVSLAGILHARTPGRTVVLLRDSETGLKKNAPRTSEGVRPDLKPEWQNGFSPPMRGG